MSTSYIHHNSASTAFVGPDAVQLYNVMALRAAISLWLKAKIKINRNGNPTNLAWAAGKVVGKTYTRSQLAQAMQDLDQWIAAMKAAIPTSQESPIP